MDRTTRDERSYGVIADSEVRVSNVGPRPTQGQFSVNEAPATAFVEALARRDFGALEATLSSAVRFRALLPSGSLELHDSATVVERLTAWFGASERFEVQEASAQAVADRLEVRYRFRLRPHPFVRESGWHVIQQVAFCEIADGTIAALDLLCTGFRPELEIESGVLHTFDAGNMGCADGLSAEFSRRIKSIAVGDVLMVVARDPAAKEDLPPLARMMGHEVLSIDQHEDRSLSITVERVR
jgi:TusA-related sulfurtransferase